MVVTPTPSDSWKTAASISKAPTWEHEVAPPTMTSWVERAAPVVTRDILARDLREGE